MTAIGISAATGRPAARPMATFALLGLSAGLPLHLYTSILALRLARSGVELATIGFFAWVALIPAVKFLWAPVLDRVAVPGFGRVWGRRRGWILASQLGIAGSVAGLAFADPARGLAGTALWAVSLAFWAAMLEIASDAWRIEVAPDAGAQGPITAAYLWGYRGAMVAAGSGVLIVADRAGWGAAYLAAGMVGLIAFALMAATPPPDRDEADRPGGLAVGLAASVAGFVVVAAGIAAIGLVAGAAMAAIGLAPGPDLAWVALVIGLIPLALLALALPAIGRLPVDAPVRASPVLGAAVDLLWRYGSIGIALLAFVALYRMGDVLALTMSKPLVASLGHSLGTIAVADGVVALAATVLGVGMGGWLAARGSPGRALAVGAVLAAIGNLAFAWLAGRQGDAPALYLATAADQFGNGFAGAVFVVYLSLIVNPAFAAGQYALLSGFAFLLPRLVAGAAGSAVEAIGYAPFFIVAAALSLAAAGLLPPLLRTSPRSAAA